MATAKIENTLKEVYELVSHFIKLPETKMLVDYDKEADVLYISFKRPQKATDSKCWIMVFCSDIKGTSWSA